MFYSYGDRQINPKSKDVEHKRNKKNKDPIGFAGEDVNLYRYVQNNPVNWGDPTGLACGSSWNDWAVPDKPGGNDFTSCCQKHDDCYGKCGKTKEDCDNEFYECMARECRRNFSGKKCVSWADRYWGAVDKWGQGAYDNGQNPSPLPR